MTVSKKIRKAGLGNWPVQSIGLAEKRGHFKGYVDHVWMIICWRVHFSIEYGKHKTVAQFFFYLF